MCVCVCGGMDKITEYLYHVGYVHTYGWNERTSTGILEEELSDLLSQIFRWYFRLFRFLERWDALRKRKKKYQPRHHPHRGEDDEKGERGLLTVTRSISCGFHAFVR